MFLWCADGYGLSIVTPLPQLESPGFLGHSECPTCLGREYKTYTTPIVPRTAMRSFILLLLILVLAKAVPVSKKLSAKGYYLLAFFSLVANAPFPLEAVLVDPKEEGFIPAK